MKILPFSEMKTKPSTYISFWMINKKLGFFSVFIMLSVTVISVSVAEEKDNLAGLIQIALEQNNEILAAKSRLAATSEKIRQAGPFPDPRLGVQYFLEPVETRTGPQEASISLNQSIPWPGRLSLARELKKNDVAIAESMLAGTSLAVVRKVKTVYIEYGYLRQARNITKQILELMNYLEGIAQTNYTNGKASYTDVLKIQIEIAKLENRILSLDDKKIPVRVRLNSLLGADKNFARPQPAKMPKIVFSQQEDEIHALARELSPMIQAGLHKVTKSRTRLSVADQGFYPDFSLSVKTILTGEAEFGDPPDSGQDPVIAGFSLNLPVFYDRRNGAIAEKQASVGTARNELAQTMDAVENGIELSLFRYREAERLFSLYNENLIPKVRQELDVALEAFQSGQYSILELIDAEKNWLHFEIAKIKALADMAIEVAGLEELVGTTLADWDQDS